MPGRTKSVNLRVVPGEATDGSGRVCIHLFVRDERGPFVEPHALHPSVKDGVQQKQLEARPTRGRLACDAKRTVAPVTKNGVTTVTPRTEEPRAVTCPKCIASAEYAKAMDLINQAEAQRG